MAFRGTFDHTLDAKNRLTIPAKFRASLAGGVVLAKGIERCVQVWTPKAYDAYVTAALAGLNPLSEPARPQRDVQPGTPARARPPTPESAMPTGFSGARASDEERRWEKMCKWGC